MTRFRSLVVALLVVAGLLSGCAVKMTDLQGINLISVDEEKKLGNQFAFAIIKPELSREMFPWLKMQDGEMRIDREWLDKNF